MSVTRYRRNERGLVKSDGGYLVAYDDYSELEAERDRLREAIATHRRNVWGESPVNHGEDCQLYAALQEDNDE